MSFTIVSFHAHPDDEALYTGGTLARLAAEGHRVVLVTATSGEAGLASEAMRDGGLGRRRVDELHRSAQALGVARVVVLGYGDSGFDRPGSAEPFAKVDVEEAAQRLADILLDEGAQALTCYDPAGGYGHPDHVQVHRVGIRAAQLAGTPLVLEATIDRDLLRSVLRVVGLVPRLPYGFSAAAVDGLYTARQDLTHRVDVRPHLAAKRAALAAHASQATATGGARTLSILLRLPGPVFRRVLGTEWFVERGRTPGTHLDDVLASLRENGRLAR